MENQISVTVTGKNSKELAEQLVKWGTALGGVTTTTGTVTKTVAPNKKPRVVETFEDDETEEEVEVSSNDEVEETEEETEVEEESDGPTKEDVREALSAFASKKKGNDAKALAVLNKFGVNHLNKLKEKDYAKVIKLLK